MHLTISAIIVVVFSAIVLLFGMMGIIAPEGLQRLTTKITNTQRGLNGIAAFRLIFGASLLLISHETLYPLILQILGIVALCSALLIFVLSGKRIQKLLGVMRKTPPVYLRILSCLAVVLGVFLISTTWQLAIRSLSS